MKFSIVATLRALATSPAWCPPIPSATRRRCPRFRPWCVACWGKLVCLTQSMRANSAIKNWSSLVGRILPLSVTPKLRTAITGRPSSGVGISGTACGWLELVGFTACVSTMLLRASQARPTNASDATRLFDRRTPFALGVTCLLVGQPASGLEVHVRGNAPLLCALQVLHPERPGLRVSPEASAQWLPQTQAKPQD